MNHDWKKIAAFCLIPLLLTRWTYSANSQVEPAHKMLFAVWPGQQGKQPDSPLLDPIAVISKSDFEQPLKYGDAQGKEAEKLYIAFQKRYLSAGQKYPLLFGGHDFGVVEVQAAVGIGCESLTAALKRPVPLLNAQKAFAASSIEGFGIHPNWRQQNTPSQRAAFIEAGSGYLVQQGATNASPSLIRLKNLRLTKLGSGGPDALIGSITFKDKTTQHNLFLVLERTETGWTVALASDHLTKDTEDYVDDVEEDFVDQIDLDASGKDEIITISYYYESWDYAIYKNRNGKWDKVYTGGGGGC